VRFPLDLHRWDPIDYPTRRGHLLIELGQQGVGDAHMISANRFIVEFGITMAARELQLQLSLTHSSDTGALGN
jgi:hypothetical protein